MKASRLVILVFMLAATMRGQQATNPPTTVQSHSTNSFAIWPGEPPEALGKADKDTPTLTVFAPTNESANGAAMIICPGGGYSHLAPHEGEGYARWLNTLGVTCFVLKYRLGADGYRYPAPQQDVSRAIRLVRARASEWNIDPKRVGVIGSSAGGHVASSAMTHFDGGNSNATDVVEQQSSRPDIAILCYPVISMGKFAHGGSKNNLLGTNPPPALIEETSTDLHLTKESPPCFIWSTEDDKTVPIENTLQFADAMRAAKVSFELHIYQHGPHGLGLGTRDYDPTKWHPWVAECTRWLKSQEFVR
jgi:acetyl esterase/lipase